MPRPRFRLHDRDRSVHERGWRLIMDRWQQERATLNDLYLQMLALRRKLASNARALPTIRAYVWQARQRFRLQPRQTALRSTMQSSARSCQQLRAGAPRRSGRAASLASLRPSDTDVDACARASQPISGSGRTGGRRLPHVPAR